MNKTMTAVVALAFIASASGASAATLTQTMDHTIRGQVFDFAFSTTEKPIGAGTLTFLVRGDFSVGDDLEFFNFNLENVLSINRVRAFDNNIVTNYNFNDNLFRMSYALTQSQLTRILLDNAVNLRVTYSNEVTIGTSASPFITATIDFPTAAAAVPEPATWAMMLVGFGMIGATVRYRRRSIQATYA